MRFGMKHAVKGLAGFPLSCNKTVLSEGHNRIDVLADLTELINAHEVPNIIEITTCKVEAALPRLVHTLKVMLH